MTKRRIVFGRVNRRSQRSISSASFSEEMRLLAELGRFEADDGDKRWTVGDIAIDDSMSFLSGIIGFTDPETRLHFDNDTNSWIKALSEEVEGASSKAVVPFAIDVRSDRRWTASVTSSRVSPKIFRRGIELALNAARSASGWLTDWEVDPVTSTDTVKRWVELHPDIRLIRRTIKLPNPGRDLSEDIQEMRDLAARRKQEEFTAHYNRNLRVVEADGRMNDAMNHLTANVETGQVELHIESRRDGVTHKFSSTKKVDEGSIPDFGDDWQLGIDFVLDALRDYSDKRAV